MKSTKRVSGTLVFTLGLAALAFALPSTVRADAGCRTAECTYAGEFAGHCGVWDTTKCGCYENDPGSGGELQAACKSGLEEN